MASASDGAVSGPVAMMALSHSAGGRPVISSRFDGDQWMGFKLFRHRLRETIAVDGKRAAGRNLMGIGGSHDQ